jgi:aminoglycoside phosphotransferase (APT) family kinase protein
MSEHAIEREALRLLWATQRLSLAPELVSALAKDRAKRSDAALARLVAGYAQLPAVRALYRERYEELLARALSLGSVSTEAGAARLAAAADNPIFVGIPAVAAALEERILALEGARDRGEISATRLDALIRDIVHLEASCRLEYESRVLAMKPTLRATDGSQGSELTRESLQTYLRCHPRGSSEVTVRQVHEIAGGRSKRTVRAELEAAAGLPAEIVLRLDTGRGVGTSVIDEFALLERVAQRGLPVPEPLWLESSRTPFGQPFIVFRRMPGTAAGDLIEGAFRKEPRTGRALARALGRVHAGGVELIDDSAGRDSAVLHTRRLLTHYREWWRLKKPFPSLTIETAFLWLFHRLEGGLGDATVVHADTGFHNLLLDDHGNACLLDWEFAHFGDAAEDLASCRPAVEQCMPWSDFVAEYQSAGGKPVSEFRLNYFEIWRPLRNAVVCGTTLHTMMQGEADDIDPVTIGLSTFQRLQADLARTLDARMESGNGP